MPSQEEAGPSRHPGRPYSGGLVSGSVSDGRVPALLGGVRRRRVGGHVRAVRDVRPQDEQAEPAGGRGAERQSRRAAPGLRPAPQGQEERREKRGRGEQHDGRVQARLDGQEEAHGEGRRLARAPAAPEAEGEEDRERQPLQGHGLEAVREDHGRRHQHAEPAPEQAQAEADPELLQHEPGAEREQGQRDDLHRGVHRGRPIAQGEAKGNREQGLRDERFRSPQRVGVGKENRRLEVARRVVQEAVDAEAQQHRAQQRVGPVVAAGDHGRLEVRRKAGHEDARSQSQREEKGRRAGTPQHRPCIARQRGPTPRARRSRVAGRRRWAGEA